MRPLVLLAVLTASALSLAWTPRAAAADPAPVPDVGTRSLEWVGSGGALRWYHVFEPTTPAPVPDARRPLVVCFHGGGGNAASAYENYGVAEEAQARGWVAVFPEGTGPLSGTGTFALQSWNAGDCCVFAAENDVDDVGFFADMLGQLVVEHDVDPDRVFVTGFSNGAMMSYRLGVERPDLVTAIAPVGGALVTDPPTARVPLLAIHGLLDTRVPFDGGMGSGLAGEVFPSQFESFVPFLEANGSCDLLPPYVHGAAMLFVAPAPAAPAIGAETWYFLALDGGHSWPGGNGSIVNPSEPQHTDVPATPLMFDFFERQ
ncbi:Alpha/beta hydrolase family protein [Planctomycetes bacterium Pla163]|uniref:Alpha/beta hydrolase family protein n=1 Tax=Rohdeia mirabilis TaxID=2528008 RepID=A0A518D4Y3_9BACT|nr:Alpha/beta hydrolase family protein [Planctomycetes bacterium Pla163]